MFTCLFNIVKSRPQENIDELKTHLLKLSSLNSLIHSASGTATFGDTNAAQVTNSVSGAGGTPDKYHNSPRVAKTGTGGYLDFENNSDTGTALSVLDGKMPAQQSFADSAPKVCQTQHKRVNADYTTYVQRIHSCTNNLMSSPCL